MPVDVKEKLILCLWGKNTEVYKGCKSDSMGALAQNGDRRSRQKVLKKVVRKERIIRKKIWKLNENRARVKFEK